jgi:hypothetical protein
VEDRVKKETTADTVGVVDEFVVTPWEVRGRVDYDKLLRHFGAKPLTPGEVALLEKYAGEVHPLIKRGFFYAHRDFDAILKWHGEGKPWALYTGRGPSGPVVLRQVWARGLLPAHRRREVLRRPGDEAGGGNRLGLRKRP